MDYEIKSCLRCGKLYPRVASPYCRECQELFDQEFQAVRDYIYEHPDARLVELSDETGVAEKTIIQFIREGRITIREKVLKCNMCGQPITSGETCDKCKQDLIQKINEVQTAAKETQGKPERNSSSKNKMHVLGNWHNKKR